MCAYVCGGKEVDEVTIVRRSGGMCTPVSLARIDKRDHAEEKDTFAISSGSDTGLTV